MLAVVVADGEGVVSAVVLLLLLVFVYGLAASLIVLVLAVLPLPLGLPLGLPLTSIVPFCLCFWVPLLTAVVLLGRAGAYTF
jgi:hypothetical protein